MRVAITQRLMESPSGTEFGEGLGHDWHAWTHEFLPEALLFPIPSIGHSLLRWCAEVAPQALVLTGGESLGINPTRDELESDALDWCARRVPVLGVCRGAQVMNVWAGGLITTDTSGAHVGTSHPVTFTRNEAQKHGSQSVTSVNSFHNQVIALRHLASDFEPLALHADNSVEAFTDSSGLLLGVMWHPERRLAANRELSVWIANHLRKGSIT